MKVILLIGIFLNFNLCSGQIVPSYRLTNWSNPGNTIYKRTDYARIINVVNYGAAGNGTHIDDTAVLRAIDTLSSKGGIIYFPAGTYLLKRAIVLPKKITLRGAGSDITILKSDLGGSGDCISASGSLTGSWYNLSGSYTPGIKYIDVPGHNFRANEWIRISQNDSNFINDSWSSGYVGQICKIDSISSNRIYLNRPLRIYLSKTLLPKAIKINPADSIGLEDFRIIRRDVTSTQTSNINFTYSTNCWIYGVQSDSCNFAHVTLNSCSNILIYGCYFTRAFSYGDGGKGYGISHQFTTGQCLVENNIFNRLRHSMLFQACANGNVMGYNYSLDPLPLTFGLALSSEIVLHGNYNYLNLFEGNICQNMIVDNSHGKNGIYNTFFRNRASGAYVGIYMSSASSDSQNYVGNEIGSFTMAGSGNFQYNNNKNGTYYASGTTSLNDTSYYLSQIPSWWNIGGNWPSIGGANTLNSGSNPAKQRYINSGLKTINLGNGQALPVKWLSFKTTLRNQKIEITWQTASELNSDFFEPERSFDGRSYKVINRLNAAGNSNVIKTYQCTDTCSKMPVTYYRIKQYDLDGKISYSVVNTVYLKNPKLYRIYPNPCNDELNIDFENAPLNGSIYILNIFGRIIMENHQLLKYNRLNFDSEAYGLYTVVIRIGQNLFKEKIMIK